MLGFLPPQGLSCILFSMSFLRKILRSISRGHIMFLRRAVEKALFEKLNRRYIETGKMKFVFKHFPFMFNEYSWESAEAAECAGYIGGNDAFWKMHDDLLSNQDKFSPDYFKKLASIQGLDKIFAENDIKLHPTLFRPANYIERSVSSITGHLLIGGLFVIIVLAVFFHTSLSEQQRAC